MSLQPLQAINPLGQFDGYDLDVLTFLGGEVCTFLYVPCPSQPGVTQTGYDQAAYDSFDGYVNVSAVLKRPVLTKTWSLCTNQVTKGPYYLADDGILNYGTLFGSVVGGTVGQQSVNGATLGPHTATGSGKLTAWFMPGLYSVSVDAVDTASNGLIPTNTALTGGDQLSFTSGGLLTPYTAGNKTGSAPVVATFVEFITTGSLVNTPSYLTAALNSPSGAVSSVGPRAFKHAVIQFHP